MMPPSETQPVQPDAPPAAERFAGPVVQAERLSVRYGKNRALNEVTATFPPGAVGLLGPNGAGKSTLLAALLGEIAFDGRIVLNWAGPGTVGYVPQSFAVDPTLPVTVADFLALTRQRRPVCLGLTAATRATVARLLDRVGLAGLDRRPLAALSGGELRRVLLAHALDPAPELLVLDEPAAGLDESAVHTLDELLLGLKRTGQTTVLMV
jgi:zinc transport system ATP-binding protein